VARKSAFDAAYERSLKAIAKAKRTAARPPKATAKKYIGPNPYLSGEKKF
jgi:hypothetical protein